MRDLQALLQDATPAAGADPAPASEGTDASPVERPPAGETRYRELFELAVEGIFRTAAGGRTISINPAGARMFGYDSPGEMSAALRDAQALWAEPERRAEFIELLRRTGSVSDYEFEGRRRDGSTAWFSMNARAVSDPDVPEMEIEGMLSDITRRHEAEAAMRESSERYHALIEHMAEGVAYCRMLFDESGNPTDWIYLDVNAAFGLQTGLWNVTGKLVSEVILGLRDTNPELLEIYGRVTRTGVSEQFETYLPALGRWFRISVYRPVAEHFAAVFEDITDRKTTMEALRASEQRFRAVVDNLVEGVVVHDRDGLIVSANPAARALLGLSVDEITGRTSFDPAWHAVWPDGTTAPGEEHPATVARTQGRIVTDVVMGVRHTSGVTRWMRVNAHPLHDSPGNEVTGAVISFHDVTEALRAEQALRDSEALLNQVQELTKLGGWSYDVANQKLTWTDEVYRIRELPRDGGPRSMAQVIESYVPEDRPRVAEAFRQATEHGRPYDFEARLVTAKGRELWVRTIGQPQLRDGRVVRVYGGVQDITEQRSAALALLSAQQRLSRFGDANIVGTVLARPDGKVLEANDYFLRLVGCTRDELERGEVDWRTLTPPEWRRADERALEELRETGVCTPYEKDFVRRDGTRVEVFVADAITPGPGDEIAAFMIDVTE